LRNKEATYEWVDIVNSIRTWFPNLKIALYSGRTAVEQNLWNLFDYIKVGPYMPEFGPLDNPNTNQRLYRINRETKELENITNLFWRKHNEIKN
jgi:anaerobic ribonucleoside-triphosphate reductase activating protein